MKLARTYTLGIVAFALAGVARADVIAIQNGGKLTILGDAGDDVIHVEGAGALGEVNVLAGVTPVPVKLAIGVRDIEIKTADGNDAVNVSGLEIGGTLKVKLGAGSDFINIDNFLRDAVTHRSAFIGGGLDVSLGGQAGDTFQCQCVLAASGDVITIGGNASVRGATSARFEGLGISSNTGEQDVFVGGNLSIRSVLGCDVALDDLNVGGTTKIALGGGADDVTLEDCHFTRKFDAKLGAGDDSITFASDVECNSDATIDGGAGDDIAAGFASVAVAGNSSAKKFEN